MLQEMFPAIESSLLTTLSSPSLSSGSESSESTAYRPVRQTLTSYLPPPQQQQQQRLIADDVDWPTANRSAYQITCTSYQQSTVRRYGGGCIPHNNNINTNSDRQSLQQPACLPTSLSSMSDPSTRYNSVPCPPASLQQRQPEHYQWPSQLPRVPPFPADHCGYPSGLQAAAAAAATQQQYGLDSLLQYDPLDYSNNWITSTTCQPTDFTDIDDDDDLVRQPQAATSSSVVAPVSPSFSRGPPAARPMYRCDGQSMYTNNDGLVAGLTATTAAAAATNSVVDTASQYRTYSKQFVTLQRQQQQQQQQQQQMNNYDFTGGNYIGQQNTGGRGLEINRRLANNNNDNNNYFNHCLAAQQQYQQQYQLQYQQRFGGASINGVTSNKSADVVSPNASSADDISTDEERQRQHYHQRLQHAFGSRPTRASMSIGKTRTREKYRSVYNEKQRIELERQYIGNTYLSAELKTSISQSTGLSERQVKIWFQNRRAKDRRCRYRNNNPQDDKTQSTVDQPAGEEEEDAEEEGLGADEVTSLLQFVC